MSKSFSRRDLLLLSAGLVLLVLVMARGTLALPYYSDDFEHAGLIAQIRAGLEPGRDLILSPFHGQLLVLLRLLFWFGTVAGGMSLTWVRLGICAAHIGAAVGCAILCARWTESQFAGVLAGTLYAGAFGFINEQIWWPSSGIFCLGVAFFIFAILALDANRPWFCLLMLILAVLGLNGILAAALALPAYGWLVRRKRPRVAVSIAVLILMAALCAAGVWRVGFSLRGFELGSWLIFTAPLRFFSGFTAFAIPGFQTILILAPLAWLPVLASTWFLRAPERRIVLFVWMPAILLAFLVGFARSDYPFRFGPGSLYTADRYYYLFLFPLVAQCVLFVSNVRLPRGSMLAVFAILAAALIGSRAHYLANVPRATFEASAHALQQGRALVQTIRVSKVRPLAFTDRLIPMDGARNNALSLAFLIYSEYPHGIPGVRLVREPLDARQAAIENSLLNPWLRPASSYIDFKSASYEEDLMSGFSWWEPPFRWMAGRASLRLIAAPGDLVISTYAPVDHLHRPIHVAVTMNGHFAGSFEISMPGIHDYLLHPPALIPGTIANITLTSDLVWHARDIYPQSLDERDLSIAISAIGFGVRP